MVNDILNNILLSFHGTYVQLQESSFSFAQSVHRELKKVKTVSTILPSKPSLFFIHTAHKKAARLWSHDLTAILTFLTPFLQPAMSLPV